MPDPVPPSSFSFNLLAGESFVYGIRATTPKAPYRVTCEPYTEGLTPDVMRTWFLQSIVPLVGPEAAQTMESLLAISREATQGFLQQAIQFREELATKIQ